MATLNQIEAARRNGAKSRGPVTEEGKARSRYNGIKHGIYAKCVVLENEDADAWALKVDQSVAAWTPADERELRLVTDIANANWRIDRLSAYEVAALDLEIDRMREEIDVAFEQIDEITRSTLAFNSLLVNNNTLQTIQSALRTQYRLRDRAIALLLRMQRDRRAETPAATQQAPAITHAGRDEANTAATSAAEPATPAAPTTADPAHNTGTNIVNIENRRTEPNNSGSTHPQSRENSKPAHSGNPAQAPTPAHGSHTRAS